MPVFLGPEGACKGRQQQAVARVPFSLLFAKTDIYIYICTHTSCYTHDVYVYIYIYRTYRSHSMHSLIEQAFVVRLQGAIHSVLVQWRVGQVCPDVCGEDGLFQECCCQVVARMVSVGLHHVCQAPRRCWQARDKTGSTVDGRRNC